MFVKLVNPKTKQVVVFSCAGEVYFGSRDEMTYQQQLSWVEFRESCHDDSRRFVVWASGGEHDPVGLTEIIIPAPRGTKSGGVAILTNWDAWLCNDAGRSVDRIHRFVFSAPSSE